MRIAVLILILIGSFGSASANTITVTGTGDTIAKDGVVTLREAVTAANANTPSGDAPAGDVGLDTIKFAIPGSGVQQIAIAQPLTITDAVVIDGYSQPGAVANSLAVGDNAVILIEVNGAAITSGLGAFVLRAGASTLRGLALVGAQASAAGTLDGIEIDTMGGNTIVGNFIGLDATGTTAHGNGAGIMAFGSPNNVIGGTAPADRNVISGNTQYGVALDGSASNSVVGNYIGTDLSGTVAIPNAIAGVYVETSSSGTIIGGTLSGAGNVISGNSGDGLAIDANHPTMQGNLIGVDAKGTGVLGNLIFGIQVQGGTNNVIGGQQPGAANIIDNNGTGIQVSAAACTIEANSIYGAGAALLVNSTSSHSAPTISVAMSTRDAASISGTVHGAANSTLLVELFASRTCPSGQSQGETFLGSTSIATDGSGNGHFDAVFPVAATGFGTATATSTTLGTSAFSPCQAFATPTPDLLSPPDLAVREPADMASEALDLAHADLAPALDLYAAIDAGAPDTHDIGAAPDGGTPIDLLGSAHDQAARAEDFASAHGSEASGCSCNVARSTPPPSNVPILLFGALGFAWRGSRRIRTSASRDID